MMLPNEAELARVRCAAKLNTTGPRLCETEDERPDCDRRITNAAREDVSKVRKMRITSFAAHQNAMSIEAEQTNDPADQHDQAGGSGSRAQ
jgi:hypothetical protein